MNRKWLMIVAEQRITCCSSFYKVTVGNTKQDSRDLSFLQKWAKSKGYFLQIWSIEVAEFYQKIANSLCLELLEMPTLSIKIRDMVKYIKEHKSAPLIPPFSSNRMKIIELFKPQNYFLRQINVIQHAEAKKRNKPKDKSKKDSILI